MINKAKIRRWRRRISFLKGDLFKQNQKEKKAEITQKKENEEYTRPL